MYTRGRANGSGLNPPKPEPFIRAFREAVDVASEYGMPLTYSGARLNGVYSAFCSYPAPTFGVTPEGNLTCCYEVLHEDDPLSREFFYGSIPVDGSRVDADEERILAIRARAALARKRCSDCFCVFTCAGDCAAKGPVCGVSDEDPMRCVITRALVLDMIEAALDGNTTRLRLAEGLRCRGVET